MKLFLVRLQRGESFSSFPSSLDRFSLSSLLLLSSSSFPSLSSWLILGLQRKRRRGENLGPKEGENGGGREDTRVILGGEEEEKEEEEELIKPRKQ